MTASSHQFGLQAIGITSDAHGHLYIFRHYFTLTTMGYLIYFIFRIGGATAYLTLLFLWFDFPVIAWAWLILGCILILRECLLYIEWSCTKPECRPWHYHCHD